MLMNSLNKSTYKISHFHIFPALKYQLNITIRSRKLTKILNFAILIKLPNIPQNFREIQQNRLTWIYSFIAQVAHAFLQSAYEHSMNCFEVQSKKLFGEVYGRDYCLEAATTWNYLHLFVILLPRVLAYL